MHYQETSAEALTSFEPHTDTLDGQILAALKQAGRAGLTDQEIEGRIGRIHQAVSANRRHLVERELVKKTALRGLTTSGRRAIRWVHADFYLPDVHDQQPEQDQNTDEDTAVEKPTGPKLQQAFF